MKDELFTTKQAAAYLGISVDHLRKLRTAGKIIGRKVSKKVIRWYKSELDGYLLRQGASK